MFENKQTVGLSGGTGLVGSYLIPLLHKKGYKTIIFQRDKNKESQTRNGSELAYWNYKTDEISVNHLARCDAMVHLAGESIAGKRWTEKQKKKIHKSRAEGTAFLCEKINIHAPQCSVLVSASAVGFYGTGQNNNILHPFLETDPAGGDFLAQVCRDWEGATKSLSPNIRKVILRTAVILAEKGGAFPKLIKTQKFKVNLVPGKGSQFLPWVHVQDHCRIILSAITNDKIKGIYNSCAPDICTVEDLLGASAKYTQPWVSIHIPETLLVLALGEMSGELIKSQAVSAKKIMESGFDFHFPLITDAIRSLME